MKYDTKRGKKRWYLIFNQNVYDQLSLTLFELEYITQLDSAKPVLIHYDEHTDYIWYLNQNSLNYKPRISTFWRQVHFNELNISSYRMINKIGSDYKNVYIDVGHSILVINQLSGM